MDGGESFCMEFIRNGKSGFCRRAGMHVPVSWCLNVCRGDPDSKSEKVAALPVLKIAGGRKPYREAGIVAHAKHLWDAGLRAMRSGLKTVSEEIFRERVVCCTTCGDADRCPYCGCFTSLKGKLESECGCPNPKTYPHLKKWPPRNYWDVCGRTMSVIITARGESDAYLKKTVESVRNTATGKVEIVVVLDGDCGDCTAGSVGDAADTVVVNKEPAGIGRSVNKVADRLKGDYIMRLDGHCLMEEGWDTKLKCACGPFEIATPVIKPATDNLEKQNAKWSYRLFYTSPYLKTRPWWNGDLIARRISPVMIESMGLCGCGISMRREDFEWYGRWSEELGQWGHNGVEWTLKAYCGSSGRGRVVLRDDCVCWHVFRNKFPYRITDYREQEFIRDWGYKKFGSEIIRMAYRFWPIPEWNDDVVKRIAAGRYSDIKIEKG